MKTISDNIESTELGPEKKIVELYRFWVGTTYWYYTTADVALVYNGNTYLPASIERGLVRYDSKAEVSQLDLKFSRLSDPVLKFISMNPVELVWVEVLRAYPDISPMETSVVFIGQIKNVRFKGLAAQVTCVSFEFFLRQPIPIHRYGPQCNWTLFDASCKKAEGVFVTTINVDVADNKMSVSAGTIGTYDTSFFALGYLKYQLNRRMIVDHVGDTVYLRYPLLDLPATAYVTLYAGCDGSIVTCRDKFDNVVNYGGHPYVPRDNPVTWE